MAVTRLSASEVSREAVEMLDLGAGIEITSPEALAASVRRAASFLSPTSTTAIAQTASEVLYGLHTDDTLRERIVQIVADLIAYGDLLELDVEDPSQSRRQIFLAPPSYVRRADSGRCFLVGVRPDGAKLLRPELMSRIQYVGYSRSIHDASADDLQALAEDGLFELRPEHWLSSPRPALAEELIASYRDRLETLGLPGDVELRILDTQSSVTYYRGRWRPPKTSDEGFFVARRPQAFGSNLWCFAHLAHGKVVKLLDFPMMSPLAPGFDEAWRLQAAIDVVTGSEQRVRVTHTSDHASVAFYSPVPSWMQRRLDLIGSRKVASSGSLFSYELPLDDLREELAFLDEMLWTRESPEG